ncbi:hypothetical protein D3C71_1255010 [compost metagenome]
MHLLLLRLQRLQNGSGTAELLLPGVKDDIVRSRPRYADPVIRPLHRLEVDQDDERITRFFALADIGYHALPSVVCRDPLVSLEAVIQLPERFFSQIKMIQRSRIDLHLPVAVV